MAELERLGRLPMEVAARVELGRLACAALESKPSDANLIREVRSLLSELLARWRVARGIGDRLELIVWDAGESARIAAVISRATANARRAPLACVARDLIAALQPFARACRARIEAVGEPRGLVERISFAIHLPKRGVGPGQARGRAAREPDLEGASAGRRRPV